MTKATPFDPPGALKPFAQAGEPARGALLAASAHESRSGAAVASLLGAIARAEELIDLESAGLESNLPIDLQDLGRRKTHALLDLTRLARALPPGIDGAALSAELGRFRDKLQRNAELLKLHLAAAGEIAAVIAGALREAEWDGTYDRPARSAGPVR